MGKIPENQLKLPNGKIITFNREQFEGIQKINHWLTNDNTFFTLSGFAGTGKEQPVDCMIQTPLGSKRIDELCVGDSIFGVDGNYIKITGIYPQGIKQAYRITMSDGTSTEAGGDHLWEILDIDSKNKKILSTIKILKSGLFYRKLIGRKKYKYSIPICQPVKYNEKILIIPPYVLGQNIIYNIWGEFDSHQIPKIYLESSIIQRYELLRGLMDAGGIIYKNKTLFTSASESIIKNIIELIQSLGGVAIMRNNRGIRGQFKYTIEIKTYENPFKFNNEDWELLKDNKPSRIITSIKKCRLVEQICISVNTKDGLYLTDNFIVTHNTTVIKKILDSYRGRVVVSAPTHKAKKVIMNTTKKQGQSLHSLLGLRPDVDLDDFNPNDPKFNPIALPRITDFNLVIVDEASMINKELFELIKVITKDSKTRVLFMGDPAQIPPIGEKESYVFTSPFNDYHHLTIIERQSDTNPLLFLYNDLRNNLNQLDGGFKRISNINPKTGEGAIFTLNKKEFRDAILEKYLSSDFQNNTDFAKVTAWRNETIRMANKIIRDEMFKKSKDVIEINDIMMGYRTITNHNQSYNIIENSADYRIVEKSKLHENKEGISGYLVKLREELAQGQFKFDDVFIVDTTNHNNLYLYADMHDFWVDASKKEKKNWIKYYEFRRNNLLITNINKYRNGVFRDKFNVIAKDMDYGYAITAHKVQGSTYNHIFMMETDININPIVKERNQIKYVVLTRPTTTATILTTKLDY